MTIILPAKPAMNSSDLLHYLGMSRQLRLYWTRQRGFPSPVQRGLYLTAEIAAFYRSRDMDVRIV